MTGWIQVRKRALFSDSMLPAVGIKDVVGEKRWGMEEAEGVLANESSHEIQTETAVYYVSDM